MLNGKDKVMSIFKHRALCSYLGHLVEVTGCLHVSTAFIPAEDTSKTVNQVGLTVVVEELFSSSPPGIEFRPSVA